MREPSGRAAAGQYMARNHKQGKNPMTDTRCPACGKHPIPSTNHGVTHQACRQVPEGFVWVDKEYTSGPRGALLALKENVK